jgi:ABC-2 type transport system permease protein
MGKTAMEEREIGEQDKGDSPIFHPALRIGGEKLGQFPGVPAPEDEFQAFRFIELRILRTLLWQTFSTARLRLSLVIVLSVLLWLGLFAILAEGFSFLKTTVPAPIHDQVVQAVFGTFFATLLLMLLFSSTIILYGLLFRSREVGLLLTLPGRSERIFLHKLQEAAILSGWGFVLLGSPTLVAYGVVAEAPWYYYAMLLPVMIAFVYIPVTLGALVCLEAVYRLPGRRRQVLLAAVLVVLAGGVWFVWSIFGHPERELLTPRWFQDMLAQLQLSEQRILPSWWLSSGLLQTAQGAWSEGIMFLVLMSSNALFCRQLAVWRAAAIYRKAYSRACGAGTVRKPAHLAWLDRGFELAMSFLPAPVRLMLLKDLRVFRRDPVQWSQFVILFGLLGLYFLNVRRFSYTLHYAAWVSMVSFLNLSVVGLLMSTFTTRFIFPLLSLEAPRLWLLGVCSLRRDTIIWSKFLFATGSLLIPCSLLVSLSDFMLQVSVRIVVLHQLTCLVLCLGLSGIAVGLGARLPNPREESPSRIAAGFGGTLNLVISTVYITLPLLLMALPGHFLEAARANPLAPPSLGHFSPLGPWLGVWFWGGTAASLALAALATALPMRLGIHAFRKLEL